MKCCETEGGSVQICDVTHKQTIKGGKDEKDNFLVINEKYKDRNCCYYRE